MSKFHFFTDYDLLNAQTSSQAFGPAGVANIGGTDYDQYRVTSLQTASATPKAYSICDGMF